MVAGVLALAAAPVAAQSFPNKPITWRIPATPGGTADLGARLFADAVTKIAGQRVVIDNRPGAGGIIAAENVAAQPPDGYMLTLPLSGMHEIIPHMQAMPFDPIESFTFITQLFSSTNYTIVPASTPANTLRELAAYAKSKPGGLNYGDVALGAPTSLVAFIFRSVAAAPLEVVHYRGAVELIKDLSTGRVDMATSTFNNFGPTLEEKTIKIIAANSTQRSERFPNVPTFGEQGYPEMVVGTWWGLAGPANMPKPVVDRLFELFSAASKDSELVAKMKAVDLNVGLSPSPEAFKALVIANKNRLEPVVKGAGMKN